MKKTIRAIALISSLFFIPLAAHAQDITGGITSLGGLVNTITGSILNALITFFATGALAAFFFGMVKFILASRDGDSTQINNGKQFMLWGVIALFVMFSVWGIVNYAQRIFGFTSNEITIPQIVPKGGTGSTGNNGGGLPVGGGGTTQTEYTCPDGVTKYYNQSDYRIVCTGSAAGGSQITDYNSCMRINGDQATCTAAYGSQAGGGQSACEGINNASMCQASGCTWSNAEMECSQ